MSLCCCTWLHLQTAICRISFLISWMFLLGTCLSAKVHVMRHMTLDINCMCSWVLPYTNVLVPLSLHWKATLKFGVHEVLRPLLLFPPQRATLLGTLCSLLYYTIGYKLLGSMCFLLFYTIVDFVRKLLILLPRLRVTRGAGLLLLLLNPICLQDKARARQVKTVVAANNPAKITK